AIPASSAPGVTEWTSWFNIDHPGGNGDYERLEAIRFYYRERVCARPMAMEVRTTEWVAAADTGEVVHSSLEKGFWCINKEQRNGRVCSNYHVRFQCPSGSCPGRIAQSYWTKWSEWGACSTTVCDDVGIQVRHRKCVNSQPLPLLLVPACQGHHSERRVCSTPPCTAKCQLACPEGRPSEDCSLCLCEGHILYGEALSVTGAPVAGAWVALASQPKVVLARTDTKGQFRLTGVCSSSSTFVSINKEKFAPIKVASVSNATGISWVHAVLKSAEKPYMVKHPEDKVRYEGGRVLLCWIKVTGTVLHLFNYFLRYHNGTLLDKKVYKYEEELVLRDLKPEQSGQYYCKTSSPAGAIKSSPSILTVIARGTPACNSTPEAHLIRLPMDCVQPGTDSKYYNAARCPHNQCTGSLDFDMRCRDGAGFCCGVQQMETRIIDCGSYSLPIRAVTQCSCQKCIQPTVLVRGRVVTADNNEPLRFGHIYIGKERVGTTGYQGSFTLHISPDTQRLVVNFVDPTQKFLDTTYGMFSVDFRDETNKEMLGAGAVQVLLDTQHVKMSEHIPKMKLWSLNPDTGVWEEESDFSYPTISDGHGRNKREDRTFLIGNIEIRERRLFNLDVPENRRCYVKVRAYMSDKFLPAEQLEGVVISLINLEPKPGYSSNPRAWGRFDSVITGSNGACLPAFCDAQRPDAYTAYVTAMMGGEELEAAPSTPKMNPNIIGVSQPYLDKIDYQRSDHDDPALKKTAFKINLAKPNQNNLDETNGPIYPYQNLIACENAPVDANHFRFFRVEKDRYEYNVVPFQENDLTTWTGDYLSWWPNPQEFRACFIKVKIHGQKEVMIRSRNLGGTHRETKDKLYGIRDIRSTRDMREANTSAACVEFKCSGMLFDQAEVDRSLISIIPQGNCRRTDTNSLLVEYLDKHPPAAQNNESHAFTMLAPVDPLGHNYGIYTVTDQNPRAAKEMAIGRCFDGTSDGSSREMKSDFGVALTFSCPERKISRESLFQRLQTNPGQT
uniref:Cartilage intermediate layer protein 2 n=1 Tax=Tetraodon nigroviridis TaxID=99883 RepID=H3D6P4_TETNG